MVITIRNTICYYLVTALEKKDFKLFKKEEDWLDKLIKKEANRWINKLIKLKMDFTHFVKLNNFTELKNNNFLLIYNCLGIINLLEKIFSKSVDIKIVELKSIHLNSDVYS